MHALFLRNLTLNPLILKVFAKTKLGETSALALPLKGRECSELLHASHFLMAPNVTPRSRCLRSRNVNTATGNRNKTVPAAIAVQSVIPEPS